jgi:ABC-type cobalamin/Fe3+-siderophores transport system ATPase subunit
MLEAINLSKHYNGAAALDSLNLKIEPGEVFCLLGANGAGKTTTINLFINFIEPTSGAAMIKGFDVTKEPLEIAEQAEWAGGGGADGDTRSVPRQGVRHARRNHEARQAGREVEHERDRARRSQEHLS